VNSSGHCLKFMLWSTKEIIMRDPQTGVGFKKKGTFDPPQSGTVFTVHAGLIDLKELYKNLSTAAGNKSREHCEHYLSEIGKLSFRLMDAQGRVDYIASRPGEPHPGLLSLADADDGYVRKYGDEFEDDEFDGGER